MKLYSIYEDEKGTKKINILGIRVYKKWLSGEFVKRAYLGGIFKTKKSLYSRSYYFCGIKFYGKKNRYLMLETKFMSIITDNTNKVQMAITVANQHSKVFPQFKNIHAGQSVVLVATGPSLLKYEPIKDAIHIGVNTSYQYPKVNLDYWFSMDLYPIKQYLEEIKNLDFIKFVGQIYQAYPYDYYLWEHHIPDCFIESCKNAYKYYMEQGNYRNINIDIETQLLPDLGSCIFSAAYFALYTGVKRIYLVGCDASANGYFNGVSQIVNSSLRRLPDAWKKFKGYAKTFYPYAEIISINPVGLKGLFKDIYTNENNEYVDEYGNLIDLNTEIGSENFSKV